MILLRSQEFLTGELSFGFLKIKMQMLFITPWKFTSCFEKKNS